MPLNPAMPLGEIPYDPAVFGPTVWALSVSCVCDERVIPLRLLRKQHAPTVTAPMLVSRMRCPRYCERPRDAAWVRTVRTGAGGQVEQEERVEVRPHPSPRT